MPLPLTFEALTDVGLERSENQDFYGSASRPGAEFYIVCDGMGGHAGGYVASRLAVQTIVETLGDTDETGSTRNLLRLALERANSAVHARARQERRLKGMGTTAVVLAIKPAQGLAYVAHVGDSRIYRLRGNTLTRLTRDHTMVQRLVDDGILTEEAAENHPNSNVISRSIGGRPQVEVEVAPEPMEVASGDIFMLCSDGLSGLVSEPEIAQILGSMSPVDASRRLVERACEGGGHDNITVEIVLVGDQPAALSTYEVVRPGPRERLVTPAPDSPAAARPAVFTPTTPPPAARPQRKNAALGWLVVLTIGIAAMLWLLLTVVRSDAPGSDEGSGEAPGASEEAPAAEALATPPPAEIPGEPAQVVDEAPAAPSNTPSPSRGRIQVEATIQVPVPSPTEAAAPAPAPTDLEPPTPAEGYLDEEAEPEMGAVADPQTGRDTAIEAAHTSGASHTVAPVRMPALQNAVGPTDGAERATQPNETP